MKNILTAFFVLSTLHFSVNTTFAGNGLDKSEYQDIFALQNNKSKNWSAIQGCLAEWANHPFKSTKSKQFRVIQSSVQVFGLGDNALSDTVNTKYPQLILIRPAVSVMSKSIYNLKNPNGWYCFKGQVNIMGKAIINIACKTHIASSKSSVTVFGKSEGNSGTTVMGKTTINRTCKETQKNKAI